MRKERRSGRARPIEKCVERSLKTKTLEGAVFNRKELRLELLETLNKLKVKVLVV
jgi:hypothetical protein